MGPVTGVENRAPGRVFLTVVKNAGRGTEAFYFAKKEVKFVTPNTRRPSGSWASASIHWRRHLSGGTQAVPKAGSWSLASQTMRAVRKSTPDAMSCRTCLPEEIVDGTRAPGDGFQARSLSGVCAISQAVHPRARP